MWDRLEEQYPAPGYSPYRANGVPSLTASDASALLKLIERGVDARGQADNDDAGAAQSAREAAAAAVARAVKPPYGRNEGALTKFQEDWLRRMLRGPYSGYPAWPSPASPASPFPPPPSPATPINAPIDDEGALQTQAAREAAARMVVNAAHHPYGKVFEPVVPDNTSTEADDPRQSQAAREAWARKVANDVRPPKGRQEGVLTEEIVKHWPLTLLPFLGAPRFAELGATVLINLLNSTRPAGEPAANATERNEAEQRVKSRRYDPATKSEMLW
jgi:hypothetical protein